MKTFTIKTAVKRSTSYITINGEYFYAVGWKSESTGHIEGPIFVKVHGRTAIEVTKEGKFREAYSIRARQYFPWSEKEKPRVD